MLGSFCLQNLQIARMFEIDEHRNGMLQGLRLEALDVARLFETDKLSAQLRQAGLVQEQWLSMSEQIRSAELVLQGTGAIHDSWLRGSSAMAEVFPQVQAMVSLAIGDTIYKQTLMERLFASLDFGAMGQTVTMLQPMLGNVEAVIGDVRRSYWAVADAIRNLPDLTSLPAYAMPGATREVFVTAQSV
jgi:hypothetical protein